MDELGGPSRPGRLSAGLDRLDGRIRDTVQGHPRSSNPKTKTIQDQPRPPNTIVRLCGFCSATPAPSAAPRRLAGLS